MIFRGGRRHLEMGLITCFRCREVHSSSVHRKDLAILIDLSSDGKYKIGFYEDLGKSILYKFWCGTNFCRLQFLNHCRNGSSIGTCGPSMLQSIWLSRNISCNDRREERAGHHPVWFFSSLLEIIRGGWMINVSFHFDFSTLSLQSLTLWYST